jgi:hypothetical protein
MSVLLTIKAFTTPQKMENNELPMMKMGATFAVKKVSCVPALSGITLARYVLVI